MVALVVFIVLLIIAIVIILTSAPLLRSNLSFFQGELAKLSFPPNTSEALAQKDLSERIDKSIQNLKDDYMKRERRQARKLIKELRHFLTAMVPCFGERDEIPSFESRCAENSKCKICNETTCVFH